MSRAKSKINLQSYEDIFGEEQVTPGGLQSIEIAKLHDFPNHPYSVPDNEELQKLAESIAENGILSPVMVVKKDESSYYIISGHRRCAAAKKAGLTEVPVIVRDISMAQATIEMVDTNIYRENILPSEKAKAYEMRMAAMKEQRKEGTIEVESGKRTDQELAELVGESRNTIQRYLRLNKLVPELREKVDAGAIPVNGGVALSYLQEQMQEQVAKEMKENLTLAQAERLKELYDASELSKSNLSAVISGNTVWTRKDLDAELAKHAQRIAEDEPYALMQIDDEEQMRNYLRQKRPAGVRGYSSSLELSYDDDHVILFEKYVSGKREACRAKYSYEIFANMVNGKWKSVQETCSWLHKKGVSMITGELLAEIVHQHPYQEDMSVEEYLLNCKRISFPSQSTYGNLSAIIAQEGIKVAGYIGTGKSSVKTMYIDFAGAVEKLTRNLKQYKEKAEEKLMRETEDLRKKEEASEEQWQKARANIEKQVADVKLRTNYSIDDVRELQIMQTEDGSEKQAIYDDALRLLYHQLDLQEEPSDGWIPCTKKQDVEDWVSNYRQWNMWHYDPVTLSKYYRFDCVDGSAVVIQRTPKYSSWTSEGMCIEEQGYILPADGRYMSLLDCERAKWEVTEHLKGVVGYQNAHPELQAACEHEETLSAEEVAEIETEAMEMTM